MNHGLYAPVIEKTNLYFDQGERRLKIAIPTEVNIALDTVCRYATGDTHTALICEGLDSETQS